MSGPLEDDSLGETVTNEKLCLIIFGEASNFIKHPLSEDFLCELLDRALTLKSTYLSCLVCKMSSQLECVCKRSAAYHHETIVTICDRNSRIDSGIENDVENTCDITNTLLTSPSCFDHSRPVKSHGSYTVDSCDNILSPSTSELEPFMTPPQSSRKIHLSLASSSQDKNFCAQCANCPCRKRLSASRKLDASFDSVAENADRLPLEHSDSGIGLDTDPGFYDMESGSEEDWDESEYNFQDDKSVTTNRRCHHNHKEHACDIDEIACNSKCLEKLPCPDKIDTSEKTDLSVGGLLNGKGKKLLSFGSKVVGFFGCFFFLHFSNHILLL